jgi:hypothetical protein
MPIVFIIIFLLYGGNNEIKTSSTKEKIDKRKEKDITKAGDNSI